MGSPSVSPLMASPALSQCLMHDQCLAGAYLMPGTVAQYVGWGQARAKKPSREISGLESLGTQVSISRKKSNVMCTFVTPAPGRLRQADPWGFLASSRSVRDYLKTQGDPHLGNDTVASMCPHSANRAGALLWVIETQDKKRTSHTERKWRCPRPRAAMAFPWASQPRVLSVCCFIS